MSNDIEQKVNNENITVEQRANRENLLVELRAISENNSAEPRGNRENICDEAARKRRGSGEKLSNEQLVLRIRTGEDAAGNMLILWQQNQGIIGKLAGKYKSMAEEEDLKQEGFLGLCEAVRHWEPDGGANFMSYAIFWIRQRMIRYGQNNGTVRISIEAGEKLRQYQKISNLFYQQTGRKPTDQEICHCMGISEGWLACIKKAARMDKIGSLDSHIDGVEELKLGDVVAGEEDIENSVLDQVQKEQLRAVVWPLVDGLPGQQSAVIRKRYQEGKTLQAIGDDLGVTRERARTIEASALRELRKPSRSGQLRPFLDDRIRSMAMSGNGVSSFQSSWTSSTERAALWAEEWEADEIGKELIMRKHGVR